MMMASKIDEQIREAMQGTGEGAGGGAGEVDPFAASTEEGLFRQAMELFHGQQRFWNVLVMVFSVVFFGIVIYAAVQFFGAETTKLQIMWATIFMYAGMAVAMMKMWGWMQMNKNCVTREIKRLELQIAALKAVAEREAD